MIHYILTNWNIQGVLLKIENLFEISRHSRYLVFQLLSVRAIKYSSYRVFDSNDNLNISKYLNSIFRKCPPGTCHFLHNVWKLIILLGNC